jgi:putative FmdB family regulatory protein
MLVHVSLLYRRAICHRDPGAAEMIYEYQCADSPCSHSWQAEQSISAAPLTECPKCGAGKAKRLISLGAGFVLKGGGWASQGYGTVMQKVEPK